MRSKLYNYGGFMLGVIQWFVLLMRRCVTALHKVIYFSTSFLILLAVSYVWQRVKLFFMGPKELKVPKGADDTMSLYYSTVLEH